MPSRKATGDECAAMKSPTILLHASSTSVSCNRSFSPSRWINFGKRSAGSAQRFCRIRFSGRPRHSARTWARSDGFISFCTGALRASHYLLREFMRRSETAATKKISIPSPHVARENIQLSAVLGDGAPRNRNTPLAQDLDNLFVAYRCITFFTFDEIEDRLLHAGVAHRFASGRLVTGSEM